jgi:hypothetical protein
MMKVGCSLCRWHINSNVNTPFFFCCPLSHHRNLRTRKRHSFFSFSSVDVVVNLSGKIVIGYYSREKNKIVTLDTFTTLVEEKDE